MFSSLKLEIDISFESEFITLIQDQISDMSSQAVFYIDCAHSFYLLSTSLLVEGGYGITFAPGLHHELPEGSHIDLARKVNILRLLTHLVHVAHRLAPILGEMRQEEGKEKGRKRRTEEKRREGR